MNLPNKLTMLRICLIPVFLFFLLWDGIAEPYARYLAIFVYLIASGTDALDGYIARKYHLITNFGKLMDPLADKLLVSAALIALVELGDIAAWVVILIISREFLITGIRLVAAGENIILAAGKLGKLKTISQILMTVYLLFGFSGEVAGMIGSGLVFLATLFTIISAIEYIVENRFVFKEM